MAHCPHGGRNSGFVGKGRSPAPSEQMMGEGRGGEEVGSHWDLMAGPGMAGYSFVSERRDWGQQPFH